MSIRTKSVIGGEEMVNDEEGVMSCAALMIKEEARKDRIRLAEESFRSFFLSV